MPTDRAMIYRFSQFEFDLDRFELRRAGQPVKLQRQALRLLRLLVESRGKLVSKERVLEEIWSGRAISEGALATQILALRRALQDNEKPHRILATVYGAGFRFLPEVQAISQGSVVGTPAGLGSAPTSGRAPRIAVLPLEWMSSNPAIPHAGKSIAADIITELTHIAGIEVLSRNTSFLLSPSGAGAEAGLKGLALSYLLTGSLEARGTSYRAQFELVEIRSDCILWSDHFDISADEMEGVHRLAVSEITHRVGAAIMQREAERVRGKPAGSLGAWERYHLGMSAIFGHMVPDFRVAVKNLKAALELNPDFAPAHAAASRAEIFRVFYGIDTDVTKALSGAVTAGKRATDLDPLNSFASLSYAHALRMNGALDEALEWANRSVEIAPNYADAHATAAAINLWTGRYTESLEHARRARELDPRNPMGFENDMHLLFASMHTGQLEESVAIARQLETHPITLANGSPLGAALTAFHHAGKETDARRVARMIVERGFNRRSLPIDVLFGKRAQATVDLVIEATTRWIS